MEQKGDTSSKEIPEISFGGFTSEVSGRPTSWLTPGISHFGNSYEGMTG